MKIDDRTHCPPFEKVSFVKLNLKCNCFFKSGQRLVDRKPVKGKERKVMHTDPAEQ